MKAKFSIIILTSAFVILMTAVLNEAIASTPITYVFTVDSTNDTADRNPGDGKCDVSVNSGDQCTLRAAIEELNALGLRQLPHKILFDIPGNGPHTITPAAALPTINVPIHIDGQSQPGTTCPTASAPANLKIILEGANRISDGLFFTEDNSTLNGFVITGFGTGVRFSSSDNSKVSCNMIGLDVDGVTPRGNLIGVYVDNSRGMTIGSVTDIADRNVISGNDEFGLFLYFADSAIAGNFIGTTADGHHAAGNRIGIYKYQYLLGGTTFQNNVISGNIESGFVLESFADEVVGNQIGVDANGASPLPNGGVGLQVVTQAQVTIGGPNERANHIAYNEGNGVTILNSGQVSLRFNAIHDNSELGIDLGADGVTLNDPGDQDQGANGLQNFPQLATRPAGFIVDGRLSSIANTRFLVDVYRSSVCDSSDHGEGEEYLQTVYVQTDAAGRVEFELDLRGDVATGDYVTATATDPDGSTSEFSQCVRVGSRRGVTLTVNQDGDLDDATPADGRCDTLPNLSGDQCTLRAALQEINALGPISDTYRLEFDIVANDVVTITPEAPLPAVQVPVEIDGSTQPGAACPVEGEPADLKIVLDGRAIPTNASGLILGDGSDGSVVRGLVIGNFRASGIWLGSGNNQIICNHIGIGPDGESDLGNRTSGIFVVGKSNLIGGLDSPNRANVISHNDIDGIFIKHSGNFTIVASNRIGTTADGRQPAGNGGSGILITASLNVIGGRAEKTGNLISGNGRDGVTIYFSDNNVLFGNRIGVSRDDGDFIPNGDHGVSILGDASYNMIGSWEAPWQSNLIAGNDGHGVVIHSSEGAYGNGNAIQNNGIFENGGLGIDLGNDGVDGNDTGDGDIGENNRQNAPLLSAQPGSRSLVIGLSSTPNTTFTVDIYRDSACDPSGFGEGRSWLARRDITTDGSGEASATFNLHGTSSQTALTATATHRDDRHTSEFSNCVMMVAAPLNHQIYLPAAMR